jgi:histidine triad (HIT) family protein
MPQSEISRVIYEDGVCRVLISRYPVEKGHLLVVSKAHYSDIFEAPDPVIGRMFSVAKRFGRIVERRLGCMGMDIGVNAGSVGSIQHLHIHILPRYSMRMLHFAPGKNEIRQKEVNEIRRLLKL